MPLPSGVETVTVTSGNPLTLPDGTPMQGKLLFTAPDLATIPGHDLVLGGTVVVPLVDGSFSVALIAGNATGLNPSGWTYAVTAVLSNAPSWIGHITLTTASTTVALADVLTPDPVVGTYATLVDPAAVLGGVTVSGTPAAGKVLMATSATTAVWQTPAAASGSVIRTASIHVVDDNLAGLPSAPTWTVVQTSGGTQLKCSVAAAVGDRIQIVGDFMHSGSHYLDWAALLSTGAIDKFMGSGAGTPLAEGEPSMYPSLSFEYVTNPPQFVVTAGQIDGSGKVTAALVHQGTGVGLVYAHSTYPFDLRVENIGPEPS